MFCKENHGKSLGVVDQGNTFFCFLGWGVGKRGMCKGQGRAGLAEEGSKVQLPPHSKGKCSVSLWII